MTEGEDIDYFGMFSFDRIITMQLTDVKFIMDEDFDAETFFSECYGVLVNDDTEPEHIVIRAYGYERYYLNDLPMHHSQHEIDNKDDYSDFELFIRPTPDFVNHLIGLGNQVKVLSPKWLADEVAQLHYEALLNYENDE